MILTKYLYVFVAVLASSSATTALAQESRAARFERIEMEKIAFITKELNLAPEEAEKFFPIYNQYREEMSKLRQEKRQRPSQSTSYFQRQNQALQPRGLNSSRDVLAFDAKELELKKSYRNRFTRVIGAARASQFFAVEEEFRDYLMRELQQRRNSRSGQ